MTDAQKYRLLEMLPGTAAWGTLAAAVIFSVIRPVWVIYFIIVFYLFWLFRVSYFAFYLVVSWREYRRAARLDWWAKLREEAPRWADYLHLIFLPTYKENIGIIRSTLKSIAASRYDVKDFVIVLAGEERDKDNFLQAAETVKREFGAIFRHILVTVHPANLSCEIPGKGSNINWAGHRAREYIDSLKIPYEKVIVSTFDVDTCVHPQYFACLTYKYATHPNPTRTSFQPIALYSNNIWDSPALVRVAAFGTTFWLMTELPRPDRLFTFSSHSMSFRALVDVGFWQKDIVTEDSRIFLQCFLKYNGDYTVTPIYVPVSMDTVMSDGYFKSLKNLYLQQRRWAWGVEHFPYMVWHFRGNPLIPFKKKIRYFLNLAEGMYSWATASLLIFLLGRLPLLIAPEAVRRSVLFQNTPYILELIMTLAMVGIFLSAFLSLLLLPPRPQTVRRRHWLPMLAQWAFLPLTLIFFGSLPALDAQTRLLLGKYLGFNVTEKRRCGTMV